MNSQAQYNYAIVNYTVNISIFMLLSQKIQNRIMLLSTQYLWYFNILCHCQHATISTKPIYNSVPYKEITKR